MYFLGNLNGEYPFENLWKWFNGRIPELVQKGEDVKKLRDTILQLAVQGRLTADWRESHRDVEPAITLVERIKEDKRKLEKAGKIKKQKPLPEISKEEIPFEIHESWKWVRPINIGIINPRNKVEDETEIGFIPMRLVPIDLGRGHELITDKWKNVKEGFTHISNGDVGIAKITPSFENGKGVIFKDLPNGVGAATTELLIIRPYIEELKREYLLVFYKSELFRKKGIETMTGTAGQKRLQKQYFSAAPLPLPPLIEQHEIVHRVGLLMKKCDEIENRLLEVDEKGKRTWESLTVHV